MTASVPQPPARFVLAPVVDGVPAWDEAVPLLLAPLQLSVPLVVAPPPHLLLVTD